MKPKLKTSDPVWLHGYHAVLLTRDGVQMKQFTIPTREPFVTDREHKLLVINGVPRFLVRSGMEVQTCINKYTLEQKLPAYTVTDVARAESI